MPTIAVLGPYKIMIYFNDHGRPHVHVLSADSAVVIEIKTRKVVHNSGVVGKDLRLILKFIEQREKDLMEAWNEAQR